MRALVACAVVGAGAVVPLHDYRAVRGRGASVAAELHHSAHAALAAILLAPLPVHAAHHTHAHLHACLGVWVHGGHDCSGTCRQMVPSGHMKKATQALASSGRAARETRWGTGLGELGMVCGGEGGEHAQTPWGREKHGEHVHYRPKEAQLATGWWKGTRATEAQMAPVFEEGWDAPLESPLQPL